MDVGGLAGTNKLQPITRGSQFPTSVPNPNGFRANLSVDAVVDVGGPDGGHEEQQLVREKVHWHQEQSKHVRRRLQHAVDRVERQACTQRNQGS